jgi:hypothetical protein
MSAGVFSGLRSTSVRSAANSEGRGQLGERADVELTGTQLRDVESGASSETAAIADRNRPVRPGLSVR